MRENWFEKILAPFADETVCAVGGVTHYDDFSITGIAMSILDFGFLYGAKGSSIGCYASNNVAFRSDTLKAVPFPVDERMRCLCYKHGQLLERAHRRVYLAPEAVVLHELPNIEKERHRRGYDHVAALWVDPQLPETAFLAEPQTAASHLLQLNYNAVMKRLKITPPDLGLTTEKVELVTAKIAELIDIDLCGIKVALAEGETNGFNQKAYKEHCILNKRQ